MNAAEKREEIVAKKGEGLELASTTSLWRDIAQVEDGYGKGTVVGEQYGRRAEISSESTQAHIQGPERG